MVPVNVIEKALVFDISVHPLPVITTGTLPGLYNSIHSESASAFVPIQAISLIMTVIGGVVALAVAVIVGVTVSVGVCVIVAVSVGVNTSSSGSADAGWLMTAKITPQKAIKNNAMIRRGCFFPNKPGFRKKVKNKASNPMNIINNKKPRSKIPAAISYHFTLN